MAEPGDGGDIIIKGGSVDIEFDDAQYPVVPGNPKIHRSPGRKIMRIHILDDRKNTVYDTEGTGVNPAKWEVRVHAKH